MTIHLNSESVFWIAVALAYYANGWAVNVVFNWDEPAKPTLKNFSATLVLCATFIFVAWKAVTAFWNLFQ